VKFDINVLPVEDIADCLFYGSRFEVVAGVLLNIQSVPLATEPGISLIILPLMRILQ
jgi:hypothetical protein